MSNNISCPACGSNKLQSLSEKRAHQLTLGKEFEYEEHIYRCEVCGTEGDFDNKTDISFRDAETQALKGSVPELIESLSQENITMARLERAFELPQRTLTRWKTGDFSAASVALLRTIKTYPFIVGVAEKKFDKGFAYQSLCEETFKAMGQFMNFYSARTTVTLSAEPQSLTVQTNTIIPTGNADFFPQPVLLASGE